MNSNNLVPRQPTYVRIDPPPLTGTIGGGPDPIGPKLIVFGVVCLGLGALAMALDRAAPAYRAQ